jgi:hypothetical protein
MRYLLVLVLATALASCGDGTKSTLDTCVDLAIDYASEMQDVQACTNADQCGQPIEDSSCGCTMDLVARNDADLTLLYRLRGQARGLQCPLVTDQTSVCPCPPADGFVCLLGVCAWNYVDQSSLSQGS